jgi:hypothetical protein
MAAMKLEMAQKDKTVSNLTAALKQAKEAIVAAEEEGRETVKAQLSIQVNFDDFEEVDIVVLYRVIASPSQRRDVFRVTYTVILDLCFLIFFGFFAEVRVRGTGETSARVCGAARG